MQLDKTLRILFNVVKIFQKFLYENTLKIRQKSQNRTFFLITEKIEIQRTVDICEWVVLHQIR